MRSLGPNLPFYPMKTIRILNNVLRCRATSILVILVLIFSPLRMHAQGAVTKVYAPTISSATTSTTYSGTGATGNSGSGLTGNTYNYKFGVGVTGNNMAVLDSFVAYGLNYHYDPATSFVKFRRVDGVVTGARKSFRIEQDGNTVAAGGTVNCFPNYDDSLERVFSERLFNVGIDNVFQNANTTNNMNVERMDVIFPYGVKATDNTKAGFVVFDWGSAGGHDPFSIAAITKLDASGNPSVYNSAVSVINTNYGSGKGGVADYVIMRKNPGEAHLLLMNNSTSQDRDGVFFRFSDLGVANNTVIYGYSVFGPDVTVSPATNMVNYANTTNFPSGTDLGGGGLDPLAVTGLWVNNATFVVLPDRVDDLHTTLMNDQVKLNWDLQNSGDLKEQVVERSIDGTNYSDLIHMPVQTGLQTALDSRPLDGINYYRLKLMQQNGSVAAYSSVNRVDTKAEITPAMDAYPNPVKNKTVNVDIRGVANGTYQLVLLNMNGQVVFRQSVIGEQAMQSTLHLPGRLTMGTYVLQLTDNTGSKISERKIIVE